MRTHIELNDKDKAQHIFESLLQDKETRQPLLLEIFIGDKSYGFTLAYNAKEITR